MVAIAQLVRALDCGSRGRGFEPHWPPQKDKKGLLYGGPFLFDLLPGIPEWIIPKIILSSFIISQTQNQKPKHRKL